METILSRIELIETLLKRRYPDYLLVRDSIEADVAKKSIKEIKVHYTVYLPHHLKLKAIVTIAKDWKFSINFPE